MIRFSALFAIIGLMSFVCALNAAPKGVETVKAAVTVHADKTVCPLQETLFGVNVHPQVKAIINKPEVIEQVKRLGYKSLRFPNGCVADLYNWKSPNEKEATIEEFLFLCDALGAEPYYTVNLQGGTEGLDGPIPEGASLEEKIKYKHTAPNPCGYTHYHYGTLEEALEFFDIYTIQRAIEGKRPILHYEMGNENWGQSRTDWTPDVYAATIKMFAQAMRDKLREAQDNYPLLEDLELYIVAVGFPVMGNNMKFADTPDRAINVAWTRELNKLKESGVIDAVQEHFYPYANANGGGLVWVEHNLRNIMYARKGLENPVLDGYKDPEIVYNMPLEFTEWNIKCWGPAWPLLMLQNAGFEDGLKGWKITGKGVQTVSWAARRGDKGLRITVGESDEPVEISQTIVMPMATKTFITGVWVRTDNPEAVKLEMKQFNEGENQGAVLGGWSATQEDMWERIVAGAQMKPDTKEVEVVLRVEEPATVYVDEFQCYHTDAERGNYSMSAVTYEQPLFCVDALREMAVGGSPRSHLHHMFGGYPCGSMLFDGTIKDLGRAFELYKDAYGDRVVAADVETPTFSYASSGNPWATHFNALAPDLEKVSMLGSMVTKDNDNLYILLINRSSDRDIEVSLDLGLEPANNVASVRTLTGPDIDLPGAKIDESSIKVGKTFKQVIAPYSAQIITIKI